VTPDNNVAENAIRLFVIGRKLLPCNPTVANLTLLPVVTEGLNDTYENCAEAYKKIRLSVTLSSLKDGLKAGFALYLVPYP
jgi:hypothetical protein